MLRVLIMSAVLGLVASHVHRRALPNTYTQKLRKVGEAQDLLNKRLNENTDYSLFKPHVHYVSLAGVALYAAKDLSVSKNNQSAVQLFEDSLGNHLPDVLLEPKETVKELEELLFQTTEKLEPLSDLVKEVCQDKSDFECNKMIDRLLKTGAYNDVKVSAMVLANASEIATVVLSKDQRLKEVADTLDVIPYLVGNELDIVELTKLIAKLLSQVHLTE